MGKLAFTCGARALNTLRGSGGRNVALRRNSFLAPRPLPNLSKAQVAPRSSTLLRMVATDSTAKVEEYKFQAEASRVMDLVINSLYSNKEIFLRELVSNASDACDKRRLLQLQNAGDNDDLTIRVRADNATRTLTIEDHGVGMTKKELVDNLGSIATSGTAKFVEALGKGRADTALIGQFGVGFYSAFLVADKVTVYTKSYMEKNAPTLRWESADTSSYSIEEVNEDVGLGASGTRVVLHIKDGNQEFLEHRRVSTLLKRFSEFIDFSIYAWDENTVMEEVPDGDEKDEEGNQKMKKVPKTVEDWKLINEKKPIWLRRPRDVTKEEYNDFYKSLARDFNDPMAYSHFVAEGDVEFRAIVFTPSTLPFELRQNMFDDNGRCVKLYVKRVFISDKFRELTPRWLTFVRGVIDSEDLPLNVSREILQQSRVLRIISKRLIRKSLDMFNDIAKDEAEYKKFWDNFGRYLKAGVIDDPDYVEDLSKLLRFSTNQSGKEMTSLGDYVSRMKDKQDEIYYLAAESKLAAENSPIIEKLTAKGYEVLYLVEPVDEICIQTLQKFKTKKNKDDKEVQEYRLTDISREGFKAPGADAEESPEAMNEKLKSLIDYMQGVLGNKVSKVQTSSRLTESPSAVVQTQFGMSPTMERFMKAQMNDDGMGAGFMDQSRVLEINPAHPVINGLNARLSKGEDEATKDTAMLLYELGMMSGGYSLEDASSFAKRIARILAAGMGEVAEAESMSATTPISDDESKSDKDEVIKPEVV